MAIVGTLLLASVFAGAQESANADAPFQYQVGDTVIIKKDCERYLTGERMSTWVYYVAHPVQQVGTEKWSNGVLLGGILSWVDPNGLTLQHAAERTNEAEQQAAQQQQEQSKQEVAERAQEAEQLNELQKAIVEQQAAAHGSTIIKADSAVAKPADTPAPAEVQQPLVEQPQQAEENLNYVEGTLPTEPNYHRFSIGVRGGAASLMHKTETGKWNCGFNALLDLQYAYYWTKFGRPYDLGILTGLSVGYTQSGMQLGINDQFTVTTNEGDLIDYSLSADRIKENDGQIQLEIPLMFSLVMHNGFFFNVGPKFILPVYTPYKQTITNPNVDAYFQTEGVHVANEVITGMVTDEQLNSKGTNANQFKVNITLTADLGYEWKLKNKDAFALGVFANYGLWNAFKNTTSDQSLISVTPPSSSSIATVDILSATDTYASKLGYFDAGLKLTYHFNFLDKKTKK
ncbi:MAG: hypothetical protein ACI30J_04500 [Paludibacteraceae bacterium]